MYCTTCGKPISEGSTFCQHCGAKVGATKAKDAWETFQEFWKQFGAVGSIILFLGAQFGASSVTSLVDGVVNPSMQGDVGSTILAIMLKTAPLTAAVAWLTVRVLRNADMHFYEFIGVLVLGVGLSYLLSVGLSLENVADIFSSQSISGLPGILIAFIQAFIRVFGWVALIQSAILGIFFGNWIKRLQPTKQS